MEINEQSRRDLSTWNQIAANYAQDAGSPQDLIYQEFKDVLWECIGDVHHSHILDVGCGAGWLSQQMAALGAQVVGIDGSAMLLAKARTLAPTITFLEADLAQGLPPMGHTFDHIISYMVLMDIPDLTQLVADIRPILRSAGSFIFTLPHPCFFHYPIRRDDVTGGYGKMISSYLQQEVWRIETWGGHNHYHRPLSFYIDLLRENRLAVTRLYEPLHIPSQPNREWSHNIPTFLLVEAIPF